MVAETEALLRERYPIVASRMLAAFIELLSQARRDHGDLDRLMILLSLANRAYGDPAVAKALLRADAAALPEGMQPRATNTLSLAQTLGLPKETVRRKLNELIDCGLAERRSDGVAITLSAVKHLAGPRDWFIRMAAVHYERIDELRELTDTARQMPAYHS